MAEDKGSLFPQTNTVDCAKVKEEPVPLNAQMPSSLGYKRKSESPTNDSNKRRFIWPVNLHHLFVAAVFDIGLRTCTPKDIHAILSADTLTAITHEHCKSQLLKLRQFRDPDRLGHQPYYDSSQMVPSGDNARSSCSASAVGDLSALSQQKQIPAQVDMQRSMIRALNSQIMQISQTLSLQATFLEHMQSSFAHQTMLYNQITSTLGNDAFPSILDASADRFGQRAVDPATASSLIHATPSLASLSAPHPPTVTAAPIGTSTHLPSAHAHTLSALPAAPSRTELSMINEMREQMTLHRKLLLKKEASMAPGLVDPPCNSLLSGSFPGHDTNDVQPLWDEDALFFFLENEFCTTPQHTDVQDAL